MDFNLSLGLDATQQLAQVQQLGRAIAEADQRADDFGKAALEAFSGGQAAAQRELQTIREVISAMNAATQATRADAVAAKEAADAQQQMRSAIEATAKAKRDQIALGEQMAAVISRERQMILLHGEALAVNTRLEEQNAAAARQMALAHAEALEIDRALAAQQSLFGRAGAGLSAAGIPVGAIAGLTAFAAASAGIHKLIDETKESQAAMAQLDAAVRSTGGSAGYTADQLGDMANELSGLTGFSDEAIERAQALLLTFDKIRGETFPATTRAALDLARRMGGDLQGAAIQLGKALQDPNEGLTALRRSGISFSDSQTKVIKSLFDTGHEAQAQVLILKEIQKEVGGAAEAYRYTLGGALDNLKIQFGNLFEASDKSTAGIIAGLNRLADLLPKVGHLLSEYIALYQKIGYALTPLSAPTPPAPPLGTSFLTRAPLMGGYLAGLQDRTSKGPPAPDLAAIKDLLAAQDLEIQKTHALNAAYGENDFELAKLQVHYETLAELQKNRINHKPEEIAALDENTRALERLRLAAAAIANVELIEKMERFAKAAAQSEAALRASQPQLTPRGLSRPDVAFLPTDFHAFDDFFKQLDEMQRRGDEAAEKYAKDFGDIWRAGIANIVTDGTKSFADFSQDVLRMFTQMLRLMEREGKSSAALGFGVAGLTGGLAGYQIGQQTGQSAPGALGGFASGAFAGAAYGPWGVAIGGLVGAAGGLLGASGAQREAAEQLKRAAQSLHDSITSYANESRNPVVSALQNELDRLAAARGQISATYPEGSGHEAEAVAEIARFEEAYKTHVLAIAADFWNGIGAQINALDGPAGAFKNAMTEADRAFDQNMEAANRLHGSEEQLQQIRDLHEKTLQQLRVAEQNRIQQINLALDAREAAALGSDTEAAAIRQRAKEEAEIFAAMKAGYSDEQITRLYHIQALEAEAEATRKAAEAAQRNADAQASYTERILRATGQNDALFAFQQQRERDSIIKDFTEGTITDVAAATGLAALEAEKWQREQERALDAAKATAQAQLDALQTQKQAIDEQIRAQQQSVDFYRNQTDTLRKFSAGLSLGGFSPLSPFQKYQEAKSQFEIVGALARGGDRNAIASLQDVVNAFLEASRGRFASSPGFVNDFNKAKELVDTVADQTAAQIPVQERILAELQSQSSQIAQQIGLLNGQLSSLQNAYSRLGEALDVQKLIDETILKELEELKKIRAATEKTAGIPSGGKPGDGGTGTPGGGGGGGRGPTGGGDLPPAAWGLFDPYLGGIINVFPGATPPIVDGAGNYWLGDVAKHIGTWYDAAGVRNPDYQTPGYAWGGDFPGGLMRVGERGEELVMSGRARVLTPQQLNAEVVAELRALQRKFDALVESTDRQTRTIAQSADASKERR